jgi:anti-sigma factor ChrR (cupin superfamily)
MAEDNAGLVLRELFAGAMTIKDYDWQPFREGVEIHRLYGGDAGQPAAALLHYAPGASVPRHVHEGFEHILILSGEQSDERGSYPVGTLLVSPPGSAHSVSSKTGCVVLAIWQRPVRFSPEAAT